MSVLLKDATPRDTGHAAASVDASGSVNATSRAEDGASNAGGAAPRPTKTRGGAGGARSSSAPLDGRSFAEILNSSGGSVRTGGGSGGRSERPSVPSLVPLAAVGRSLTLKGKIAVPVIQPDIAQKVVNTMMKHGKKATAQRLFNTMLEKVKDAEMTRLRGKTPTAAAAAATDTTTTTTDGTEHNRSSRVDPMAVFLEAMENLRPLVGVAPVKRGGAKYQVPTPLGEKARTVRAVKWLVKSCRDKKNRRDFASVLANEVLAAHRREGTAYGKKLELHRTAEANRAYSNLRKS